MGRPGASGMLVPMRFSENGAGPSYTVQSLHDRDALVLALQNSGAPDYESVFSHADAGAGSSVWAADGGRTYLRGPLEETVDLVRLLLLHHLCGGLAADGKTLTLFTLIPQVSPSPPMCIPSNQA